MFQLWHSEFYQWHGITLNGIRFLMKQNEFYMWWDKIFPVKMIFICDKVCFTSGRMSFTCDRMSFYLWGRVFTRDRVCFTSDRVCFTSDRVNFTCDKVRSASWESTCRLCCGLHTVIRRLREGLQSMGSESCNTCFSSNNRTPW